MAALARFGVARLPAGLAERAAAERAVRLHHDARRQAELPPPRDVGDVAERADHRDAGALLGVGELVRHDRHAAPGTAASTPSCRRATRYRSSSGCATSATHAGISSGRVVSISIVPAVLAVERDRGGTAPSRLAILDLGLRDGGPEVDVPQRRRLGLVGEPSAQQPQERDAARSAASARRSSCRCSVQSTDSPSRRKSASNAFSSSTVSRSQSSMKLRGRPEPACVGRALQRRTSNAGSYGSGGVAAHAEVVLHAALGGQAVVVPPHRIEDLEAAHALEPRHEVGVRVAHRRGRRAASRSRWAAACRSRRTGRGSSCGRTGRCRRPPTIRPTWPPVRRATACRARSWRQSTEPSLTRWPPWIAPRPHADSAKRRRGAVLPDMRDGPAAGDAPPVGRGCATTIASAPTCGTPVEETARPPVPNEARHGPVRRRHRVDHAGRAAGSRAAARRHGHATSRHARGDRGRGRHGREVHRRRRDGGVRRAARPRGRPGAGAPGRDPHAAGGSRRSTANSSRPTGSRLQMRIGVNTRRGARGRGSGPGEPMVTGDVVNTAARLQTAAEPGELLAAERTAPRGSRIPVAEDRGTSS